MANPRVNRSCRQCGQTREHYTRAGGRIISPCAECQIAKGSKRQDAIRDDPARLEVQRTKWTRYKKIQRLREKGPAPEGATAQPKIAPGESMVARRRRRRRNGLKPPRSAPPT